MGMTTQAVTIPEERVEELKQWAEEAGGTSAPWNLVLGKHGYLYLDGSQPSLESELRMSVAANLPDMRLNSLNSIPEGLRREMLHIAADSYEWMNEGYLDRIEEVEILKVLEDALESRGPVNLPDAKAKIQHLRTRAALQKLPDWEDMTNAQQAIVDEAFRMDSRWQRDGTIEDGPAQLAQRYLMRTL